MAWRIFSVNGEPDRVLHAPAAHVALGGQAVQQPVGYARPIGTDQQLLTVGAGDLGDRLGQHLDVIEGRIRPGVPGPQLRAATWLAGTPPGRHAHTWQC